MRQTDKVDEHADLGNIDVRFFERSPGMEAPRWQIEWDPPEGPTGPGGSRAEINTFLIADVRGYTLFTQERGDEQAAKLAARFAAIAREVIETRGGSLLELRGDEALAVFGSARQAIRAAIDLQSRFVEETEAQPDLPLPVGIGLDAGEAVPVEGGYRGGVLNLAARLCGQAGPGQVFASPEVTHLARKIDGVRYIDLGAFRFKGLDEPVHVVGVSSEVSDPAAFFKALAPTRAGSRTGPVRSRARVALIVGLAIVVIAAIAIPVLIFSGGAGIASVGANSVGVIDVKTGTLVAGVQVGQVPVGIASGAGFVWVVNSGDDTVSKIDPTTRSVVDLIPVGHGPTAIAFGDNHVWVTAAGDRELDEISPATGEIVRPIRIGGGAAAVAFGDGAVWVVDSADNEVLRIDADTAKVLAHVPVGASPSGIAVDASVWISNSGSDTVTRIDPETGSNIGTVPVGGGPVGIVATADSLWVANGTDGTVTRIDPRIARATATVPVGDGPSAVVGAGGSVWVTNQFGTTVTRIDPDSSATTEVPLGGRPVAAAAVGDALWTVVQASVGTHVGGTLEIVGGYVYYIDPNLGYDLNSWQLTSLTNDGLVGFERVGGLQSATLVPDLATSIPVPTDGGRTYTFQLRAGIHYSSGAVVQPEDLRTAVERSFSPKGPGLGPTFYDALVGAASCEDPNHPNQCDLSRGITTDDASDTVTFHLRRLDPNFLYELARPGAFAVPTGTRVGDPDVQRVPATGPYVVASYVPGERVELVRNPEFQQWSAEAQPAGFPDRIDWRFGGDPAHQVHQVERGAADVNLDTPPTDLLDELRVRYPEQLHLYHPSVVRYLWLNTHIGPFDHVLARRALNYAVDRDRLVRIYGRGVAQATCQVIPPDLPGYAPYCPYSTRPAEEGTYNGPDLRTARQLVARSGTRGAKVVLLERNPPDLLAARYVVSILNRLGYEAELKVIPGDRYIDAESSGTFQMGVGGWLADYPAASDVIDVILSCSAELNYGGFCEPGIQRSIDRAVQATTYDPASAPASWAKADRALVDAAAWLPLVNDVGYVFVGTRVGNYQTSQPYAGVLLDQLWVR